MSQPSSYSELYRELETPQTQTERENAELTAEVDRLNRLNADLQVKLAAANDAEGAAEERERAAIAKANALQEEIDRSLARAPGNILAAARSLAEIIKALAETDEKLYEISADDVAKRLDKSSDYIQNLSYEERLELIEELAREFFAML